jgi:hypothetical protein
MKTNIFWRWACGLILAGLPLVGGCDQEVANSAPVAGATSNQEITTTMASITNAASPEEAEQKLENAPGQLISSPKTVPSNVKLSSPALEVVKLAQAGVDESVMLTFVTNSQNVFNLSSDDIIYLNDVGVPGTVVTAMLQRDQITRTTSANIATAPGAPTPYPTTETTAPEPPPETVQPPPANVSYTYFYDSLSPYGSWVDIAGYGRCWQPTVGVGNRGWQPYCDRGRWVYSDCGWYWASDYTWGWAPFHYGRWFRHSRWGWCWAPDTVWGPSWVSWRFTPDVCGWAPLPPTACFTPGLGFTFRGQSVGFGFSFGLTASHFAFVPTRNFCDRQPFSHRLSAHDANQVFNNTVVVNQIVQGGHNRIINHGIPVSRVSAATHREIHPVRIETTDNPSRLRADGGNRDGAHTLTAFRPEMPQPARGTALVGEGVKPAPQHNSSHRFERNPTAINNSNPDSVNPHNRIAPVDPNPRNNSNPGAVPQSPGAANSNHREMNRGDHNVETPPVVSNESPARKESSPTTVSGPQPVTTTPGTERNGSLIMRGANRPAPSNNERSAAPANPNSGHNQNGAGRARLLTPVPETPVQPAAPIQNNPPVQNNAPTPNQRSLTVPRQPMPPQSQPQSQPATPAPRARFMSPIPNQVDRPNEKAVFQEAPRQSQRPVVISPTGPVGGRQASPGFQTPRMIQPREQTGFNPSMQRQAGFSGSRSVTPGMQTAPSAQPGGSASPKSSHSDNDDRHH